MPIRIREGADPLSDASRQASDDRVLIQAQSEAGRLLRQELQRYCRGEINGRSFLIAGHRGAGKTTMVADAVDRVLRQSTKVPMSEQLRPLPVFLQGPNLFDHEAEGDAQTMEEQARTALTQIILGLHRAVVREFARAYRARLAERHREAVAATRTAFAELAAQFELELGGDPSAARLREFWALADALDEGVLAGPADTRQAGRGAQELLALSGICEAYRRISGELSSQAKSQQGLQTKDESSTGVTLKGAELVRPVVSVLSGAAVAGGAAGSAGVGGALLAGVATALAASFMFERTRTRTESESHQTDTTFIPDLSLKTLDRVLPTLLQRLRQAGLAPLLIVDELDKVDKLSERIVGMIRFLKKLVAENVFTCFLTDRGYLEQQRLEVRGAYSPSYSYFSHSLLVNFQPADFDAYLDRLLQVEADPLAAPRPGTATPAVTADGPEVATAAPVDSHDNVDLLDLEVVKWVLRHRAELHALTLNREIALMRDDSRRLAISPGVVRTDMAYLLAVTFQVIIELQLVRPEVAAWLRLHPERGQTLIDALYFLSRQWLSGDVTLHWSGGADAERQLTNYLIKRMNLEVADPERKAHVLPPDDVELLLGVVTRMVGQLSQTTTKAEVAQWWAKVQTSSSVSVPHARPTQAVLNALQLGDKSPLVLDTAVDPPRFTWRYRPSGMPHGSPKTGHDGALDAAGNLLEVHRQLAEALRDVTHIRALQTLLGTLLPVGSTPVPAPDSVFEFLAEGVRLLPTSPAWQPVSAAMLSLEQGQTSLAQTAELQAQRGTVRAFAQMLDDNWPTLARTLCVSAYLCGTSQRPETGTPGDLAREALRLVSAGLRFARLSAPEIGRAIEELAAQFQQGDPAWQLPAPGARDELDTQVQASFRQGTQWGTALRREDKADAAWAAARDHLQRLPAATAPSAPSRALSGPELIAAMDSLGPVRLLGRDYEAASLATWSTALLMALGRVKNPISRVHQVPAWLLPTALRRLGAQGLDARQQAQLSSWLLGMKRTSEGNDAELVSWMEVTSSASGSGALALCYVERDTSPMRRWAQAPTQGVALVVRADTAPADLARPDVSALGLPVILAQDGTPRGSGQNRIQTQGNAPAAHIWVYPEPMPGMREPAIVNPASADDVLRLAFETPGSATTYK